MRHPKFPRKAVEAVQSQTSYDLLKYPVTTEAAMQKIEKLNTLVFIVSMKATKPTIKRAFEKLYNIKVRNVNTLITFAFFKTLLFLFYFFIISPRGEKKAYIRLSPECEALDVANKIGVV